MKSLCLVLVSSASLSLTAFAQNSKQQAAFDKFQEVLEDKGSFKGTDHFGERYTTTSKVLRIDPKGFGLKLIQDGHMQISFEYPSVEWSQVKSLVMEKMEGEEGLAGYIQLNAKVENSMAVSFDKLQPGTPKSMPKSDRVLLWFLKRADANEFRDCLLAAQKAALGKQR